MEALTIDLLRKSRHFLDNIRWDVTPKIFFPGASSARGQEAVDATHGYMFYIDLVDGTPALLVMQLKHTMSKTVGYIQDVPEGMLKEAMQCEATECVAGMYPITGKIEDWLKKEFGLS